MEKNAFDVAKIVATPTSHSWSQAYNAGNFFAVLSIAKPEEETSSDLLNTLGKSIIDSLEEEYFTLEVKDLASIKQAISVVFEKIPSDISATFAAASKTHDNILYIFVKGQGRILLKREGNLGTILRGDDKAISCASGHLKDNDVVILATEKFLEIVPDEKILSTIDNFSSSEIVETLAPLVHEKEEGEACAMTIRFRDLKSQLEIESPDLSQESSDEAEPRSEESIQIQETPSSFILEKILSFKKGWFTKALQLNHRKKIFLTVAALLAATLLISIVSSVKKQQDEKIQAILKEVVGKAEKKYDEGQGLVSLNRTLAKEDFLEASKILNEGKNKLPVNSKEQKQITEFLKKVEDALTSVSDTSSVEPKVEDSNRSPLLLYESKLSQSQRKTRSFTQDDKNIYFADLNAVTVVDKSSKKETTLIKNDGQWQNASGVGLYFDNVYILDKKLGQIHKFVKDDKGYSRTNYLSSETKPNFPNVLSMAIDNSIWMLLKDNILKFTRGKQEGFKISGLEVQFNNPTRLFTSLDLDNLYILDNGNNRIVVLGKDGAYKMSYQAKIISKAEDFEVLEKDKLIYILSSGKIYRIDLK